MACCVWGLPPRGLDVGGRGWSQVSLGGWIHRLWIGWTPVASQPPLACAVLKADTLPDIFSGKIGPANGGCYLYGRSFNPTVRYLGRQLAALEGAEDAYCTRSVAEWWMV